MHVGIVSFGYPPIPHVSGTRAASMAAELGALGHEVTVVTVDWRPAGVDRPVVSGDRGLRVVRVDPRAWHPAFDVTAPPFATEPPVGRVRRRIRTVKQTLAWGAHARWAQAALTELVAVHAEHPLHVAWAIHGDDSSHEIAFRFHRATGVPWVADFKDPWNLFHGKALVPLQWLATSRRLRTAAALTETSEAQGSLDSRFGRPWHTVWSGYDAAVMGGALATRVSPRFTLAYFGNVGPQHDLESLSRALGQWPGGRRSGDAELHVFAHPSEGWQESLHRHGVASLLHTHDPVARADAFARMKGADVLVLLPSTHGRSGVLVGVKELEYLASGTPVLSMGSLLPELHRAMGPLPQVVEAADETDAVRFLDEERAAFAEGRRSSRRRMVNAPNVACFSWPFQAKKLAAILADAAGRG